jgi:membrane protein required for beta-lactamase induction
MSTAFMLVLMIALIPILTLLRAASIVAHCAYLLVKLIDVLLVAIGDDVTRRIYALYEAITGEQLVEESE